MISLFELKHTRGCRCCYKMPFYIRNTFLLGILGMILGVIYLIYFRHDVLTLQNIPKILKGLNSETFNHLELYMDYLKVRESPYRGKTNIAPH